MVTQVLFRYVPIMVLLLAGVVFSITGLWGRRSVAGAVGFGGLLTAELLRVSWIATFPHYTERQPVWFDWFRATVSDAGPVLQLVGVALLVYAVSRERRPREAAKQAAEVRGQGAPTTEHMAG